MAVSRVKTWIAGEVLTASDLNSEFNNILNNGEDLGWPATEAKDLNGQSIILDADADTSITADTDDQIDIAIAGADDFRITANTFTALSGSTIAADTIAETTADSGVTVDGVLIKDGSVTITDDIIHSGDINNLISFDTDTQDFQTGGSSRLDISDSGVRLGGANTRVTTILDEDTMSSDSATALATQQSIKAYVDARSRGHISGLTFANNGTDADHDIDIAAGQARDSTNARNIVLASALTKRIDASWAVGTNQGGLDGSESVDGTPDADTWYYIWSIERSDTGVVDVLFSESATAPTMPTNYDYKRRIGAVLTNGSANIIAFSAFEMAGGGLEMRWDDPPLDLDTTAQSTSAIARTLSVPTGFKVRVWLNMFISAAGGNPAVYVRSPDQNDEASSVTAAPLASLSGMASENIGGMVGPILTNTSGQVTTISTVASTTVKMALIAYEDHRRD